jgi:hypothetical protein
MRSRRAEEQHREGQKIRIDFARGIRTTETVKTIESSKIL